MADTQNPEGLIVLDFGGTLSTLKREITQKLFDPTETKCKIVIATAASDRNSVESYLEWAKIPREEWPEIITSAKKDRPSSRFYDDLAARHQLSPNRCLSIDDDRRTVANAHDEGGFHGLWFGDDAQVRHHSGRGHEFKNFGDKMPLLDAIQQITSTWNPGRPKAEAVETSPEKLPLG
jgi:hypothetical protein